MSLDDLITRQYSRINGLRRRGLIGPAAGDCEIPECGYLADLAANGYQPRRGSVVYDHCHRHDYIRGVICLMHNSSMAKIDAGVLPDDVSRFGRAFCDQVAREHSRLLDHWSRCPQCAAAGPWEPVQTEREYRQSQIINRIVRLGHALPPEDELRDFNARVRFLLRQGEI